MLQRNRRPPVPPALAWKSIRKKSRRRTSGSRKSEKRKAESANPTPTPIEIRDAVTVCMLSGENPKCQLEKAGVRGLKNGEELVLKITAAATLQARASCHFAQRRDAAFVDRTTHVFAVPPTRQITASQYANKWFPWAPCDVHHSKELAKPETFPRVPREGAATRCGLSADAARRRIIPVDK